jgi:general secretion pathway protein N
LSAAANGRVLLADTQGSVWQGSGVLVLAGVDAQHPTRVPGRVAWALDLPALLRAHLVVIFEADIAPAQRIPVDLDTRGALRLGPGSLGFPAQILTGLGAPWNTIRPTGMIGLSWNAWDPDVPGANGGGRLSWTNASSAICAVDPLGTYQLDISAWREGATLRLTTISGPMDVNGDGTIGGPSGVRFRARARVRDGTDDRIANQVASVVALLGPREADGAAIQIGM